MAQGLRLTAQGKNNQRKLILSLCLTPYALRLEPLLPTVPWNFALAQRAKFPMVNDFPMPGSNQSTYFLPAKPVMYSSHSIGNRYRFLLLHSLQTAATLFFVVLPPRIMGTM